MKYTNLTKLSDLIADLVKFHYDSKSAQDIEHDKKLAAEYFAIKDEYELSVLVPEQNIFNPSIVSTNARLLDIARENQLARWHIGKNIIATYAMPLPDHTEDCWLFMYLINVKNIVMSFQCQADSTDVFNYQLSVMKFKDEKSLKTLDVYEYFIQNRLELCSA